MDIKQTVTIIDVARRAQVSAGTVSNMLTGKRPVAEETRLRIMEAIEALGYQPNLLARSLVSRFSNTLGVIAAGLEYYGPSRTLVGIEQKANELGYSLLLDLLHNPEETDIDSALDDLTSRRVDGIIWAVHEVKNNRDLINPERLRALPPIVFLTMETRPQTSIISTDNCAGSRLATQHLIDQGRRSIAIITGPQTWWEARERMRGWQLCLADAGLEAPDAVVYEGDWTARSGEQGIRHLLSKYPTIDAVVVGNDQMALGVFRALHYLGRRVPEDLAVVGYDNIPEAPFLVPSLTSVRQHLTELGCIAVEELHKFIEARVQDAPPPEPVVRLIMPELVVRESSSGIPLV